MPIYEYTCAKCGNNFEVLLRKKSDAPGKCPKCGAPKPQKQLSSFAVAAAPPAGLVPNCHGCGSAGTGCGAGPCHLAGSG